MTYEAAVKVFNAKGSLVNKILKANTEDALAAKIDKLADSGNLYEVTGFRQQD